MERIELRISREGEVVQVADASGAARQLSWSISHLLELARALAGCGGPVPPALLERGGSLLEELLGVPAGARLLACAGAWRGGPPAALLWLALEDPRLHEVPWEALASARAPGGSLGASAAVSVARAAPTRGPVSPRALAGSLHVLPVIPDAALESQVTDELLELVEAGALELAPAISRERAGGVDRFLASLRGAPAPNVLHYAGTGSSRGKPRIQLAEFHGRPAWIELEQVAAALVATRLRASLRLVVLDTRERAIASDFAAQAAETLSEHGVDATIAYLWRVEPEHADALTRALYRALCVPEGDCAGDVAASLGRARAALSGHAAAAFAPVVYLRAPQPALFELSSARARDQDASPRPRAQPQRVLSRPCSLILGDRGVTPARGYQRVVERLIHALNQDEVARAELGGTLGMQKAPLSTLAQRYVLRFGTESLRRLLATVAYEASAQASPVPLLIDAVAVALRPGLHVSMHWLPDLERALALHNPDRDIISILPGRAGGELAPQVAVRRAGASGWVHDDARRTVDDIVGAGADAFIVLRALGGAGLVSGTAPSRTLLSEDDFARGPRWPDDWEVALRGLLATRPALFLGVAALSWEHRRALRWLFGERPAAAGSVAILSDETGECERDAWRQHAGGLAEGAHVEVVARHEAELVDALAG